MLRRRHCLWLVAALTLAGCGSAPAGGGSTPQVGAHPGDVAPALAGTSLAGHRLALSSLRGSVVVVLFWASWCAPCQAEQPAVNALAQQEASSGVRFLGVSVDIDRLAAQSYVAHYAVPYDNLVDTAQTIVVDYEVAGPPTTFVIDKGGRVSAELVGELSAASLRARIASALSGH
jgi:cytochrome c biogenesis protein CcmG/thiol:disulfide interchange protein DsbE